MRHRHGLRKLNRTSSHRLAMLRNMTNSLLAHEAIRTTLPKAKELRRVAEPLITLGKNPTLANRRLAFDRLRDKDSVYKLFNELGPRYAKRPGGYLRILRFGFRVGDNAPMALVELLDRPAVTEETESAGETKEKGVAKKRDGEPKKVRNSGKDKTEKETAEAKTEGKGRGRRKAKSKGAAKSKSKKKASAG